MRQCSPVEILKSRHVPKFTIWRNYRADCWDIWADPADQSPWIYMRWIVRQFVPERVVNLYKYMYVYMYRYVYIDMCIYIFVYTYICIYIYIYISICTRTYIYICIHIYIYIYIALWIHISNFCDEHVDVFFWKRSEYMYCAPLRAWVCGESIFFFCARWTHISFFTSWICIFFSSTRSIWICAGSWQSVWLMYTHFFFPFCAVNVYTCFWAVFSFFFFERAVNVQHFVLERAVYVWLRVYVCVCACMFPSVTHVNHSWLTTCNVTHTVCVQECVCVCACMLPSQCACVCLFNVCVCCNVCVCMFACFVCMFACFLRAVKCVRVYLHVCMCVSCA